MKFKNRIPYEYFITKGKGESNIGIHTGSFDQALQNAGIGNQNLIFYSSILPPEAKRVKAKKLRYGSVVESIAAIKNGVKGERITAGIGIAWVYEGKKKIIGLVAEYEGNEKPEDAKKKLRKSLKEMFESRFNGRLYSIRKMETYVESFTPKKKYGTVLVAICFVSYIYPE